MIADISFHIPGTAADGTPLADAQNQLQKATKDLERVLNAIGGSLKILPILQHDSAPGSTNPHPLPA